MPAKVGTREEWLAARNELLERENEHAQRSEELAQKRRELPCAPVEKQYTLQTDSRIAFYLPQTQYPAREMTMVVRSARDPAGGGEIVRD